MLDLSYLVILILFVLPIMLGVVLSFCKACLVKRLMWGEIALSILGLAGLGLLGERDIATGLFFLGEQITFSVTALPIYLYASALFTLAVLLWQERDNQKEPISRYQGVLLSLSLSSGLVAFFSGQFMIRYIAIDVVGLLAALTVLTSFSDWSALKGFILIFQVLRLGDLSLLASILLINHYTATLDISQMISGAVALPLNLRTWIYFGFLLSLLIKLAIWPFGLWLQKAKEFAHGVLFWISGVLTPVLGYYLLYRVMPIIHSESFFKDLLLVLGLVLFLLILLVKSLRLVPVDRFTHMSGLTSCFLLGALAFDPNPKLLYFFLVGLVLYRLALALHEQISTITVRYLLALIPGLVNGIFLAANFSQFPGWLIAAWIGLTVITVFWDIWAIYKGGLDDWQPFLLSVADASEVADAGTDPIPQGMVSAAELKNGAYRLSGVLGRIAGWMYLNIEMRLEGLWILLGEKLIMVSEFGWHSIEVAAVSKTGDLLDDALKSLEAHERNVLKRSLRWDLAWIPLMLVIILMMLFVT